jgi:hypothetical protein
MANGRRSIFSRRQSLAPGSYDTPLADFLDALPQYVTQYQQNQLKINQQELASKRYDDSIKQQEYQNELSLYRLLPDEVRSEAMSKSENEEISQIGTKAVNNKKAFLDQLNFTDIEKSDSDMLDYYNNLLTSPNVAGNKTRESQIQSKIKSQQNKILKTAITDYYDRNPDDKFKDINLQRAQYEPDEVIKDLNEQALKGVSGTRKVIQGADGYKYYQDTGERVLPNVIKSVPAGATLESLNQLLQSAERKMILDKALMTPEELNNLNNEIDKYKNKIRELTGLNEQPTLKLPSLNPTKRESTKINIPGLNFD